MEIYWFENFIREKHMDDDTGINEIRKIAIHTVNQTKATTFSLVLWKYIILILISKQSFMLKI